MAGASSDASNNVIPLNKHPLGCEHVPLLTEIAYGSTVIGTIKTSLPNQVQFEGGGYFVRDPEGDRGQQLRYQPSEVSSAKIPEHKTVELELLPPAPNQSDRLEGDHTQVSLVDKSRTPVPGTDLKLIRVPLVFPAGGPPSLELKKVGAYGPEAECRVSSLLQYNVYFKTALSRASAALRVVLNAREERELMVNTDGYSLVYVFRAEGRVCRFIYRSEMGSLGSSGDMVQINESDLIFILNGPSNVDATKLPIMGHLCQLMERKPPTAQELAEFLRAMQSVYPGLAIIHLTATRPDSHNTT